MFNSRALLKDVLYFELRHLIQLRNTLEVYDWETYLPVCNISSITLRVLTR